MALPVWQFLLCITNWITLKSLSYSCMWACQIFLYPLIVVHFFLFTAIFTLFWLNNNANIVLMPELLIARKFFTIQCENFDGIKKIDEWIIEKVSNFLHTCSYRYKSIWGSLRAFNKKIISCIIYFLSTFFPLLMDFSHN